MGRWFFLFLFIGFVSSAHAETLSMTTYYPAPFGAYDRMRLVPRAALTGSCSIGMLYVNSTSANPEYCRDDGGGTGTWGKIPGAWDQNGNNIYPADNDTNSALRVGIGTKTPTAQLQVFRNGADATLKVTREAGSDFQITSSSTAASLGTTNAKDLNLQTSNTTRMTILSDGKVGIGTTAPSTALEINGNQKIIGYITVDGDAGDSVIRFTNTAGFSFAIGMDASDGNRFKINVGNNPGDQAQFSIDPTTGDLRVGGKIYVKSDSVNTGEIKLRYINDATQPGYYAMYAP